MNNKPVVGIVVVLFAVVGGVAARTAFHAVRAEPGVQAEVLTQAWTKEDFGGKAFSFESPVALKPEPLELPAEVRSQIREMQSLAGKAKGLDVMASYMALPDGRTANLEGAADGAIANTRKTKGTASVDATKHETTAGGLPAIEIDANVRQDSGEQLKMHMLIVGRGPEMVQVIVVHQHDQPVGDRAWQKLLGTVKVKG